MPEKEEKKMFFVWSVIEHANEDKDIYNDLPGTTKKLGEFRTYKEALEWQASLINLGGE